MRPSLKRVAVCRTVRFQLRDEIRGQGAVVLFMQLLHSLPLSSPPPRDRLINLHKHASAVFVSTCARARHYRNNGRSRGTAVVVTRDWERSAAGRMRGLLGDNCRRKDILFATDLLTRWWHWWVEWRGGEWKANLLPISLARTGGVLGTKQDSAASKSTKVSLKIKNARSSLLETLHFTIITIEAEFIYENNK